MFVNTSSMDCTEIIYYPEFLFIQPEVIEKYGYPVEIHQTVTEDGYVITMFRIPYSPKSPADLNKPVALLHHGLGGTSRVWVFLGPNKALGKLKLDVSFFFCGLELAKEPHWSTILLQLTDRW